MLAKLKQSFSYKPLTQSHRQSWYRRPASISERLSWMEYSDTDECFLLADGRSVAAVIECEDIAAEARGEKYLQQLLRGLQGLFQDVFPMYFDNESPWVVQFYLQDELSLQPFYQRYCDYIAEKARSSMLTKAYQKILRQHLQYMTQKQGIFIDEKVSGLPYRGKQRKVRMVLYRKLHSKSKLRSGLSPIQDLNNVTNALLSKLSSSSITAKRLDGQDFYAWLLPWFNPNPRAFGGDIDALLAATLLNKQTPVFGYEFSERLFHSTPRSDAKKGAWYFDDKPHKLLSITGLNYLPETGHLSLERSFANQHYSLFDKLPEGSVLVMTVVIQSQEVVKNHIDAIERSTKKATSTEGQMAREDCELARRAMETGNYLFPSSLGVYLRGDNDADLSQKETDVLTLLTNNGLSVVDGDSELLPLDSYLRYLPMNYDFDFDKRYLSRSRYLSGLQLAQLAPFYGRERGTGHPGLLFYNRIGEPFTVDPFHPSDKDNNSHMLILGTTGSGKSAMCTYLMLHLMATYRPRLVIVDAGNSFGLLSEYFKELGLNVNRVEIALTSTTSLNPFAESHKMLQQIDTLEQEQLLRLVEANEQEMVEAKEAASDTEKQETGENRDYMGEMALAARLMITGGERKEEARISRQDRMLILDALISAAHTAESEQRQMLPEDLANVLTAMADDLRAQDSEKSSRCREMADGIRVFCKDTLSSQFFNRPGEPWPDADVTILEMGLFKEDGYEAQRALAFMGAMNKTMSLAEANQYDDRFTVFFGDECHVVTKNPLTAVSVTKCSKMSRKIGLWLWLATQNVEDFPNEARKMLSMIEFWICLGMSESELKEVERFKVLTEEERSLFRSVRKEAKKYVEGVILCQRFKGLFRNIPPRIALALAMTEKHEKAERKQLMAQTGCTEVEAAKMVASRMLGLVE